MSEPVEKAAGPATFRELRRHLRADLFRYHGSSGFRQFLYSFFREPGFKFTFWMRLCKFLYRRRLSWLGLYYPARFLYSHYRFKYGIHIDFTTVIGPGFYICHVGAIVINRRCVIGKNCNLSHEVTLGYKSRGEKKGCPTVGDNVYIAPGAKLIGNITVGDRVAIGANSVVTKDVPENGVVVGIPGKVISDEGSEGYVNDTEWET